MREHLWRTPPGAAMRPPVTDDAVRDAQRRLGVKLLTSYVELLKVRNGGYLRYDSHPAAVPTSWATDHVGVEHIMGIGPGPAGNILDTPWLVEEWGMPEGLVLLSGDGHTWIALDYRSCGPSGEPSVVWIDNELDEEVRLAPDFQTFLDGLVPGNHRHVFGFVGVRDSPDRLLAELGRIFDTSFTKSTPDPSFPGPVTEWNSYMDRDRDLWVSPNRTLWGDVEYPEHPECGWVLECDIGTDDTERVAALLAEHIPYPTVLVHRPRWLLERS